MKILIKNCHILPMDIKQERILDGNIGIEGDRILFLGEIPPGFKPDTIFDGANTVAMPGFVNAHTHIGMSMFRNFADDMPLFPWLHKIWPLEEKLTNEDIYWSSMLSIAEMIRGGVTCFHDMYFMIEETFRCVQESGIRGYLSHAFSGEEVDKEKLDQARRHYETYHGAFQGRAEVTLGPHAPYTVGPKFMSAISDLASDLGARIHIHLSETQSEVQESFEKWGKSPIAHVADLGLFANPTIAAHCVVVDENDLDILRQYDVCVAHNPSSNLKLASGIAPAWSMAQKGIAVCLGTDGPSSNNNLNMLEEVHLAALLGKVQAKDAAAFSAWDAVSMGTKYGAKALGAEKEFGTLEIGKKADLILVDLTAPHFYPRHNLISAMAYSAQASDVKMVMVDGRVLLDNFAFTTLDLEKIVWHAQRCADNLTT